MGTLVWGSTGRPMAQCPVCGRVHTVLRRKDYLEQPTVRFHCRNPECKTNWVASAEEKQKLAEHFTAHQAKKKPPTTPKQKPSTPPAQPTENTETGRKSSFWDHFA